MTRSGPRRLDALTSPEVAAGTPTVLLVPLGATEQHGPHLEVGTDTRIALAWADAVADRITGAVVAPPLPYGSSGEHQSFPGTLSIGQDALQLLLVELARSAKHDFSRIVFLSGHGGNAQPLRRAVDQLRTEGHDAYGFLPRIAGSDPHAGHTETSILLHLAPETVRLDRSEAGTTAPLESIIDSLQTGGVAAVSPNGVLGDPTTATAAAGADLLEYLVETVVVALSAPSATPTP